LIGLGSVWRGGHLQQSGRPTVYLGSKEDSRDDSKTEKDSDCTLRIGLRLSGKGIARGG
jgi:hypothetical protein